jgi:hypothetical protein
MSWLKAFGKGALTGVKIAGAIAGVIPPTLPQGKPQDTAQHVSDTIGAIASVVMTVEAMGQAFNQPGADKLRVAVPLVEQVVLASPIMQGKSVENQEAFHAACTGLTNDIVALLNSVK